MRTRSCAIGEYLALAPLGGKVTFLSALSDKQMPGALLSQGTVEAWDLIKKKRLATKVRARARAGALAREVVIEAVSAIQHNTHPRLMEQQLGAFLRQRQDARGWDVAA